VTRIPTTALATPNGAGWTTLEVSGGEFTFSAAHMGLHDGRFEPLHGHTFTAALRLSGTPNPATGMLLDFTEAKTALRQAIHPLRRRTLLPANAPEVTVHEGGQVVVDDGHKRYELPAEDVTLLPVPNTTTEAIASWLVARVTPALQGATRLRRIELVLAEAPDTAATVVAMLPETLR
jgi:6-pyruvoyl-tetrahydropterin synthase